LFVSIKPKYHKHFRAILYPHQVKEQRNEHTRNFWAALTGQPDPGIGSCSPSPTEASAASALERNGFARVS
jgi:hypothetical protein